MNRFHVWYFVPKWILTWCSLYLRKTKSCRWEGRGGEKVHLLTHTTARGVGKNVTERREGGPARVWGSDEDSCLLSSLSLSFVSRRRTPSWVRVAHLSCHGWADLASMVNGVLTGLEYNCLTMWPSWLTPTCMSRTGMRPLLYELGTSTVNCMWGVYEAKNPHCPIIHIASTCSNITSKKV